MRGNLRFALTALTWAVILLAIYALSAHAQTREPHSVVGVGWAAQAGVPGLPVLRGGLKESSVTGGPIAAGSGTIESAFRVTRRSL